MGICSWLVFGLVVGVIARAILPGEQRMGLIKTSLVGIGGSFVGGLLGTILSGGRWSFHPSGIIGSVIGAIVLILLFGRSGRRY
jgi:uncharacterized membrane protein YeaQ/YmgE (transglycosylase-associated protein family)